MRAIIPDLTNSIPRPALVHVNYANREQKYLFKMNTDYIHYRPQEEKHNDIRM
uniref:Uncharacterized protein n=1 Tax=Anguilla anguilla TaxID=7936 RepID=A0A0E9UJ15_ANGAN